MKNNKEIEVIDENGIWQLVKEGDRYVVRTCYVYEDYENYDTYRLPNDLAETAFANYVEPSSYPPGVSLSPKPFHLLQWND